MAVLSGGTSVKLWDVATETNYAALDHDDHVTNVAFSPDGTSLASTSAKVVTLWDPATGAPTAVLEGHTYWVGAVAFSPDGTTLASLSGAYGLRLWDVETQRTVATIENTLGGSAMSFSRDGATLVCASQYLVNLWDVGTRARIDSLAHGDRVRAVAFAPDGQTLATGTRKGVELWDAAEWLKPRAHGLVGISGDGQEGPPGAILENPLVVEVRDQYGNGLAGVQVTFAVTEGDGRLSGRDTVQNTETDDNGRAVGVLTLGTGPDTTTVEAKLLKADPVRFSAVTVKPHALIIVSGDGQEGQPGALLPGSLVVEVRDVDGNPLEGVPVTFAVLVGGGTLSAPTDNTDENGRAATTLTLGNQPRKNIVVGRVAEVTPVVFSFSAVGHAVPKTLTKLSGDKQEAPSWGALPEPLVVLVRDQNDDPVKGALVAFAVTAGEGSLSSATVLTDEKGRAATTLTLGSRPGPYTVEATVTGLDPVTFTALANATTDFDGDGETGFADFFLFADAFGGSDPRFDLDGSGSVDFGDFFLFADHFGDPARGKLLALAREMIGLPDGPQLQQNAPNPFNSETVISWFLLRPGPARVEVFALTGQRVAVLHQGAKKAGVHRVHWDGRDDRGRPLASGVYLYRLVTDESVQTRKLTLLR